MYEDSGVVHEIPSNLMFAFDWELSLGPCVFVGPCSGPCCGHLRYLCLKAYHPGHMIWIDLNRIPGCLASPPPCWPLHAGPTCLRFFGGPATASRPTLGYPSLTPSFSLPLFSLFLNASPRSGVTWGMLARLMHCWAWKFESSKVLVYLGIIFINPR